MLYSALECDPTTWSECQNPRKPAHGCQEFHPRESPDTPFAPLQFLCLRNCTQCSFPCCFCDEAALDSRGKHFTGVLRPGPPPHAPRLGAAAYRVSQRVPAAGARTWVARNLLLVSRTSGWNLLHRRPGLCYVQSVRSAAPGARHEYRNRKRVDPNGSVPANASGSALATPGAHLGNRQNAEGHFQGARRPPGRKAAPSLLDHGANHHRIGKGRDLRGSEAPRGA